MTLALIAGHSCIPHVIAPDAGNDDAGDRPFPLECYEVVHNDDGTNSYQWSGACDDLPECEDRFDAGSAQPCARDLDCETDERCDIASDGGEVGCCRLAE